MPGNFDKSSRSGPSARPPTYVNVPTQVAYAPVPDALVVTMVRILGLCWTNRYRHSPPLTTEQLARLLDRPRSTLQRHLDMLERELGWLRREHRDRRFVLHPCPPFSVHPLPEDLDPSPGTAESQEDTKECSSAPEVPGDERQPSHVAGEPADSGHGHARSAPAASGTPSTFVGGEPLRPGRNGSGHTFRAPYNRRRSLSEILAEKQDLIQALADVGIQNPARERIALEGVLEPDWIAAWQLWAEHPYRANLSNLPGYIVQCLKHRERPPEEYLQLVRLTSAEKAQLEGSRWDGGGDLDPHLQKIQSLYLHHFPLRG